MKPYKRRKINGSSNGLISYIMCAPFLILFLCFVIIPILSAVFLSFTNFNLLEAPKLSGLQNYKQLLVNDDVFVIAIKNTLIFSFITGPIGYFLSFFFAWLISELPRRVRSVAVLAFYTPSLTGNVYFIWKYIFSGDSYGLLNGTLFKLGLILSPIQWLTDKRYTMAVVTIVILWLSMGAGFLSFIAGFQTLNHELSESASIDGVSNRWQELWYVTLPQLVPQMVFAAVMSISASFSVGYQSMELTGFPSTDYSTHTILLHMLDFGTIRYEMGYASAIAVVLFLMMLLTWAVVNKLLRKIG